MKAFLITLIIIAIAVFTGTWIFDACSWVFDILSNAFKFLAKIFNLFGWNGGVL